ncbi:hypothetical protein [uncultured Jannaschia sp.]|uniref:hypothetical protein n=1 Tax=uncultured Jannaschia sp. TaxID=293347 RepID=UPI00261F3952|nr:hypothetical protein [uncultured Jannaschia sp.]
MTDDPEILMVGRTLPGPRYEKLLGTGTSGAIDMPGQMMLMTLADFRKGDEAAFGPARFCIAVAKTFLMVSPAFAGFSFDIVWTPAAAQATGEPVLPEPAPGEQMLMTFVLLDGLMVIRGIRQATISPACWRGQRKHMAKAPRQEESLRQMEKVFSRYPKGFQDGFFHESCAFGD